MFDLMPYGRRNQVFNPFHDLDNLEKHFFSGLGISEFKTDITEKDDAYLLEAGPFRDSARKISMLMSKIISS